LVQEHPVLDDVDSMIDVRVGKDVSLSAKIGLDFLKLNTGVAELLSGNLDSPTIDRLSHISRSGYGELQQTASATVAYGREP
jgi:hypothetical protein